MARKKLKLYVWPGVLSDYTSGIALALAKSPEQAIEQLKKAGLADHYIDGTQVDGVEPTVHDSPFGTFVYGGS